MADDDESTLVVLQESPQPGDRVGVEVVGRLVEQQRRVRLPGTVGSGKQDARQLDSSSLATGQSAQRLTEHTVGQAE